MEKSDPCLALTLGSLPEEKASQSSGSKHAYFGYEFETPWPQPEKVAAYSSAVDLVFHGDYGVLFWNPAERRNFIAQLTAEMQQPQVKKELETVIGKDAARSDYDLLRGGLDMTAKQISPALSKLGAVQRLTLLRTKSVECTNKPSAFYAFQSQNVKCLQIGDPSKDASVEVRCFDPSDREFNFHIGARKDSGVHVTQTDINRVIQTLRPAPVSSAESAAMANQAKN